MTILHDLTARERLLLAPDSTVSPADLDALLDAHFHETGASGRLYTREATLADLLRRRDAGAGTPARMSEVQCDPIATDVHLLTYLLEQPGRLTRRSSLWRRSEAGWKILYHQGTVLGPQSADT